MFLNLLLFVRDLNIRALKGNHARGSQLVDHCSIGNSSGLGTSKSQDEEEQQLAQALWWD
jgi:hypothetical protein